MHALKNSSDQHCDGDVLTHRSVWDPAPEPSVEARSEVPAPSFYGKLEYQASMSESLPSSAPWQYVHIYGVGHLVTTYFGQWPNWVGNGQPLIY